ncbi:unnamed protein product [Oikopleura dioica]|uniref:PH domain-containing protein n=1 Tax=Oikopleura dioica TaxID=34765 RepID=E4Z2I3_OIKDI|nr:unnamed protein product [Oikopleura dioica]
MVLTRRALSFRTPSMPAPKEPENEIVSYGASNVVLRFISRHRLLISRLTVRCTLTQTNLKLVRAFPGDFGISKDKKRALRGGDFGYHITDLDWRWVHLVVGEGVLAISDPTTFHLQSRISLAIAKVREVRHRGRGVLKLTLSDNTCYYLRYKDRTERRRWLGCLLQQTSIRPKNISSYPSFLPSKPYKEPALQVRTKRSASQMSSSGNSTTEINAYDTSAVSRNESEMIAQEKIQRSMKRRKSAISVLAMIPKAIKKRLSIA